MAASLGVWASGPAADGVAYRWEADNGEGGRGFVHFDPATLRFRPWDGDGFVGDLVVDAASGDVEGSADGVDRRLLLQVVGSIMRAFTREGSAPATAHAYFH